MGWQDEGGIEESFLMFFTIKNVLHFCIFFFI